MAVGRWYPSLVTLGNGKVFVASGVEKLVKPIYPDHPLDSFANVRKTETYDPGTGRWTDNGTTAASDAAAVPAAAPAAERPRLLQRRRPGLQPVRPVLRRGALEHRRVLRPGDGALAGPRRARRGRRVARGPARPRLRPARLGPRQARHPGRRQEPHAARLPRLHVLGDAAAPARRARPLHQGVVPHGRRRGQPGGAQPGQLLLHERRPHHHGRHASAATRSRRSRQATCTGRAGTPRASCCPRARQSPSPARTATRWPCRAPSSRSSRPSSGIRRPATGPRSPRPTGRGPTTTPPCCCPTDGC